MAVYSMAPLLRENLLQWLFRFSVKGITFRTVPICLFTRLGIIGILQKMDEMNIASFNSPGQQNQNLIILNIFMNL